LTSSYRALHFAILGYKTNKIIRYLLDRIDIQSFADSPVHPIHLAVAKRNHGILDNLLAYLSESTNCSLDTLKCVLEAQINVSGLTIEWSLTGPSALYTTKDISSGTALHVAASTGDEHASRILLDYGAFVDSTNNLGQTPLHVATLGGKTRRCQTSFRTRR
jgi:ankyrin repeat protein